MPCANVPVNPDCLDARIPLMAFSRADGLLRVAVRNRTKTEGKYARFGARTCDEDESSYCASCSSASSASPIAYTGCPCAFLQPKLERGQCKMGCFGYICKGCGSPINGDFFAGGEKRVMIVAIPTACKATAIMNIFVD
jgi:hypothetical protein